MHTLANNRNKYPNEMRIFPNQMPAHPTKSLLPISKQDIFPNDHLQQTQKPRPNPHRSVPRLLSQLHHHFSLRHQTLFLAFQLHRTLSASITDFPSLCLTSLYIAMKVQEIYPPCLKQLTTCLKFQLTNEQYTKVEIEALKLLNYHPQMPICLGQSLQPMSVCDRFHVYYVLELSYTDIQEKESLEEIMSALCYLRSPMKMSLAPVVSYMGVKWSIIEKCCKRIYFLRSVAAGRAPQVHRKYQSMRYNQVANRPLYE